MDPHSLQPQRDARGEGRGTSGGGRPGATAVTTLGQESPSQTVVHNIGLVHPAYNPYFSACFFNWNSVFLSQQISQQCFSAGLSAQPNGAIIANAIVENLIIFYVSLEYVYMILLVSIF
jgi:hypothetical protein